MSADSPAMTPNVPTSMCSPRQHLIAEGVLSTKGLLNRYLSGFGDPTHVRQTPDLPNHVAWQLGHLALTMHKVGGMLDGKPLPAGDFLTGDGTKGSRDVGKFDTEAVSFGSRPEERYDRFPTLPRCVEIYDQACERLAHSVRSVPDAKLDELLPWGMGQQIPAGVLVQRMIFHNGFHCGQIADLRRALGFRSIFA